jgi:hypothetical protein
LQVSWYFTITSESDEANIFWMKIFLDAMKIMSKAVHLSYIRLFCCLMASLVLLMTMQRIRKMFLQTKHRWQDLSLGASNNSTSSLVNDLSAWGTSCPLDLLLVIITSLSMISWLFPLQERLLLSNWHFLQHHLYRVVTQVGLVFCIKHRSHCEHDVWVYVLYHRDNIGGDRIDWEVTGESRSAG